MFEWICETCGWVLEIPDGQAPPESCPLCSKLHELSNSNPGRHRWMSADDALAVFEQGDSLTNVYIEKIELDEVTFEHRIKLIDSVIGSWSSRETTFVGGLDVSGTWFLERFHTGAGKSEHLQRFAHAAHFEDDLKMVRTRLVNGGSFEGCQISQDLEAFGFHSDGQVDLSGVEVGGTAIFEAAVFDILLMRGTRFKDELNFKAAHVKRDFNATGISVQGRFKANQAEFHGEFYVGESLFEQELNFYKAIFHNQLAIDSTEFQSGFEFDSACVKGVLDFRETEFGGWADFEWAKFEDTVYLEGIQFFNVASFEDSSFDGRVEFRIVNFHEEAYLRRAKFARDFRMILGRFHKRVDLRNVTFAHDMHFERVTCNRTLYMSRSIFSGATQWIGSTFEAPLIGLECRFEGDTRWHHCNFERVLILTGSYFGQRFEMPGSTVGEQLDIKQVQFDNALDLTQCTLQGPVCLEDVVGDQFQFELEQARKHLTSETNKDWKQANKDWIYLKESFDRRNRAGDSAFAYYKVRQMRNRSERIGRGRIWSYLELVFIEWGTGYGTRPGNVFILSFVAVVFFALLMQVLFSSSVPVEGSSFTDYLKFSFSTFSSLESGDLIVSIEAFIGGFFTAFFTALLTRRIFRD